jgi:hypothetical protein
MRHTSSAITSAPNPFLLETRILSNHSKDPRFSFLRGRWKRVWVALKSGNEVGEDGKVVVKKAAFAGGAGVVALLGGYGSDSDEDSGSGSGSGSGDEGQGEGGKEKGTEPEGLGEKDTEVAAAVEAGEREVLLSVEGSAVLGESATAGQVTQEGDDAEAEAKKEARRQKLKAWALERKTAATSGDAGATLHT